MAECVEIGLELNECTEVCESYDRTLNDGTNGDPLLDVVVRIILFLLVAEGDLLRLRIELLNIYIYFLTDGQNL